MARVSPARLRDPTSVPFDDPLATFLPGTVPTTHPAPPSRAHRARLPSLQPGTYNCPLIVHGDVTLAAGVYILTQGISVSRVLSGQYAPRLHRWSTPVPDRRHRQLRHRLHRFDHATHRGPISDGNHRSRPQPCRACGCGKRAPTATPPRFERAPATAAVRLMFPEQLST